jgi:hypothetical protein
VSALPNEPAPDFPTGLRLATERGADYGHPSINFRFIARLWAIIDDADWLTPEEDVALRMLAVKFARLIQTPAHNDSIEDLAGYCATMQMLAGLEPSV